MVLFVCPVTSSTFSLFSLFMHFNDEGTNIMSPWTLTLTLGIVFHLRRAVMADVEVLVSGVGTMGHSTAQLVGPVPHNLRATQHSQLQALATFECHVLWTVSHVTATHLCEVSHHTSVDRSHSVAPVLNLIVPGLGHVAPAPLGGGHVEVLPAAARCREQKIDRRKGHGLLKSQSDNRHLHLKQRTKTEAEIKPPLYI